MSILRREYGMMMYHHGKLVIIYFLVQASKLTLALLLSSKSHLLSICIAFKQLIEASKCLLPSTSTCRYATESISIACKWGYKGVKNGETLSGISYMRPAINSQITIKTSKD